MQQQAQYQQNQWTWCGCCCNSNQVILKSKRSFVTCQMGWNSLEALPDIQHSQFTFHRGRFQPLPIKARMDLKTRGRGKIYRSTAMQVIHTKSNTCSQDRLQWHIDRGTTQNLLPTLSQKGGAIQTSNVDTNSPPVSGPACCSAAPEGNWGCCRQPVSAGQSNTWRRRWLGRWCWTGAIPGSGAPSHSCRAWNKADSRSKNSAFSSYDIEQQQGAQLFLVQWLTLWWRKINTHMSSTVISLRIWQ